MSDVLLDTHVIVWWLLGDTLLPVKIRRLIDQAETIHVSVASLYEIAFKRERARRRGGPDPLSRLPDDLITAFYLSDFVVQDVTADQAHAAALLPMTHGDPWDRILVAQARDLGVALITGDKVLREQAADTPVIW